VFAGRKGQGREGWKGRKGAEVVGRSARCFRGVRRERGGREEARRKTSRTRAARETNQIMKKNKSIMLDDFDNNKLSLPCSTHKHCNKAETKTSSLIIFCIYRF
jgi:hypothetical protein